MTFDCSALFELGMKSGFLVLWFWKGGLKTLRSKKLGAWC